MFNEGCRLQCSSYLWSSTFHIRVFFWQILVATIAHSTQIQLELNVAITADSTDTSGQHTASQVLTLKTHASRAFVERCLDPLDWSKYYIRHTDSVGNVKFKRLKCSNNLVFNPRNEQCTFRSSDINNSPFLPFVNGSECNGFQGDYCSRTALTYCKAE